MQNCGVGATTRNDEKMTKPRIRVLVLFFGRVSSIYVRACVFCPLSALSPQPVFVQPRPIDPAQHRRLSPATNHKPPKMPSTLSTPSAAAQRASVSCKQAALPATNSNSSSSTTKRVSAAAAAAAAAGLLLGGNASPACAAVEMSSGVPPAPQQVQHISSTTAVKFPSVKAPAGAHCIVSLRCVRCAHCVKIAASGCIRACGPCGPCMHLSWWHISEECMHACMHLLQHLTFDNATHSSLS